MAYLDAKPMTPARLWSVGIVVTLHAGLLYALVTGTYTQVIDKITGIPTRNIPIEKPPEPVDVVPLPKPANTRTAIATPRPRVDTPAPTPTEVWTTPLPTETYRDPVPGPVFTPLPPSPPVADPVPDVPGIATRARLRGGSISDSDYPSGAIRNEEQGRSTATYTVDANGRVSSCSAAGAGPLLDAQTCKLIQSRFRVAPAKATRGAPGAQTKTQTIEWVLPK